MAINSVGEKRKSLRSVIYISTTGNWKIKSKLSSRRGKRKTRNIRLKIN